MPTTTEKRRVYLDLTHLGRHVTGIERVSIEQFERVPFNDATLIPVRSSGVISMILRQQVLLPLYALRHPSALFVFPGFPPSPFFSLIRHRVLMYVHDTFLITRQMDLSTKARLYMAPQFRRAVTSLQHFLVNSEKTRDDLAQHTKPGASIGLYRPGVRNVFNLSSGPRASREASPRPLRLISLGTVEPRKNYAAALAILDQLRATSNPDAELHIVGRAGWGPDADLISAHPGTKVHGYLSAEEVKKRMDDADVYLCTSHDEGLGLPLLEAQYAGLPVVAPDQPVFREVLGASGAFIDPSNPQTAANLIAGIFSAPNWREAHAAAALANVSRWNALAASDLDVAKQVFAGQPGNAATGTAIRTS
jgi:glycosyltransferase involved in cell wall biosynthesis